PSQPPPSPLPRITNENRHYYHVRSLAAIAHPLPQPVPALSTLLAPHADSECVLLGDLNGDMLNPLLHATTQHRDTLSSEPPSLNSSVPSASLQRPFSVPSASLQRPFSVPSASLHRPFSVPSVSLQSPFSVPSVSLQRPFSVPSASLQRPSIVPSVSLQSPFSVPLSL
ncbi:hypothetical protein KUCAC02_035215, partial [Chaenocephalus aceratus]